MSEMEKEDGDGVSENVPGSFPRYSHQNLYLIPDVHSRAVREGVRAPEAREDVRTGPSKHVVGSGDVASVFSERFLRLEFLGGKGFFGEPTFSRSSSPETSTLCICVCFLNFRWKSDSVPLLAASEIRQSVRLPFEHREGNLVNFTELIHIVVLMRSLNGSMTFMGALAIDWRGALTSRSVRTELELAAKSGISSGVLEVSLEFEPALVPSDRVSPSQLKAQVSAEKREKWDCERDFFSEVAKWTNVVPGKFRRNFTLFSTDECGVRRFVCSFVQILDVHRSLDTPRRAARWVSLFPLNESVPFWFSPHSFVCRGEGGVADHALLLCSVLLGLGLNAFVCVGTNCDGGPHMWVVTIGERVWFWESLTGVRFLAEDDHGFATVDCLFNDRMFFGNVGPDRSVYGCGFDLADVRAWKTLSYEKGPGHWRRSMTALSDLNAPLPRAVNEYEVEKCLRGLITDHRGALRLPTDWDERLSILFAPALYAHDLALVTGISFGNEEFRDAIKHYIPKGQAIRALPLQSRSCSANMLFASLLASSVAKDLLSLHRENCHFALRVRVTLYPEDRTDVWLMIGCRYNTDSTST